MSRPLAAAAALAALLAARPARADGAYGRLDGDLAPSLEAGVSAAPRRTVALAQLRLLYLATAGLQVGLLAPRPDIGLSVSLGAEVRPLFLGRFTANREQGPPRWDLALDSLSLGLAARLADGRPPGLDLTAGFEVPLGQQYSGFFLGLRALRHWPHGALAGLDDRPELSGLLTLGFRVVLQAHLVDAHDQVFR